MVISWTRFWEKVVSFREQSARSLGQHCGENVAGIRRKWTSYFLCKDSIVQGCSLEQKVRKIVDTVRCRSSHSWYNLSHHFFCQSAQCLRSSGKPYAKNSRAIKIDQEILKFWWVNQLCSTKLKQKTFCKTKIAWTTKLFGSNTFNKLNRFHQKTKWVNSVRKQDLCVCWNWTIFRDQGYW